MPADFSAAAKRVRMQIAVPPLDIEVIRERSAGSGVRERLRRLSAGAATILGAVGAAAALASTAGGWHLWLFDNKVKIAVQSLATVREPMAPDVQAIVEGADFSVVLPDGLPNGLRVVGLGYSPIERPTLMTIQYGDASDPWAVAVTLFDTKTLADNAKLLPIGPARAFMTQGYHFRIGRETVLVQGRHISSAQAVHVQSEMQRESPAQTAAAFEALLPRIVVLQKVTQQVASAAERIAPAGRNVVVADWDIRIIPHLAARDKPLRDSRTIYVTNIPPTSFYRNATFYWPKRIAIPADGVRAVAAALLHSHTGPNCLCSILVHSFNGRYTVWKIDQKNLKVTPLQR